MLISEGVDYAVLDAKAPEDLTEEEKTSMLGRPRLGDVTKIQIRIRESKEFKVCRLRVQNQGLYEKVYTNPLFVTVFEYIFSWWCERETQNQDDRIHGLGTHDD